MSKRHSRKLFISAALFSLLAGLPLLLAPGPASALLGLSLNPAAILFMHITMGVVVVFGFTYWLIARNPVRYRPYIGLSIVLKLLVASVILGHWLSGNTGLHFPILAFGDLSFGMMMKWLG